MERKKELKIGTPLVIGDITLIPVAELSIIRWRGGKCLFCSGTKQPVAIVVVSPSGKQAFRASGEEVPLDQLTLEVPRILEVLERF